MEIRVNAHDLPWTVPVPVRTSGFVPVDAKDRRYNVEVDLARLQAFTNRKAPVRDRDLLFADLQTNPDVNLGRRLGSGRSGFHRGAYLKGVGRTLVAGNWNRPDDLYHSSGLLLTSAGIRELLVSDMLAALGKGHVANACTGLLLKPLPRGFGSHAARIFSAVKGYGDHAADRRFQALSVKGGAFSRLSNFVWWLSHYPQFEFGELSPMGHFFLLLHRALVAPRTHDDELHLSPEAIAGAFVRSVDRGLDNFLEAWRCGVIWGSLHNNFTVDGRFLDLETPMVFPAPILGRAFNALKHRDRLGPTASTRTLLFGVDVIDYATQVLIFIRFLRARLRYLAEVQALAAPERRFAEQFVDALVARLSAEHPLSSHERFAEFLVARLAGVLELAGRDLGLLRRLVASSLDEVPFLGARRATRRRAGAEITLYRLELPELAQHEPAVRLAVYVPAFLRDRAAPAQGPQALYNQAVLRAQSMRDMDALLQFLADTRREFSAQRSILEPDATRRASHRPAQ
jgi:hypothetical protein